MNNIAHSQFRASKQAAAAPREPALRRLLKQALVNKWNPDDGVCTAVQGESVDKKLPISYLGKR